MLDADRRVTTNPSHHVNRGQEERRARVFPERFDCGCVEAGTVSRFDDDVGQALCGGAHRPDFNERTASVARNSSSSAMSERASGLACLCEARYGEC